MRVKLISKTENPIEIMYVAARTCYSEKSPIDLCMEVNARLNPKESCMKLLKQVLGSGHLSIAEHVNFTFAIEGISRACSHQLIRHRLCSFSQQSQRYVDMENCSFIQPKGMVDKAFEIFQIDIIQQYKSLINCGLKKEDARAILPNCTATNLVMTCNLRQLIHISELRLCTRAQKEIRELFQEIKKEVGIYEPEIAKLLVPKCERLGFCDEHESCGRKSNDKATIHNR